MKKEYCTIFNQCFPQFHMSWQRFQSLLDSTKCTFYEYAEDGQLLGFAITQDFAIRLICVAPEKQKQGIGRQLLADIEADLAQKGYEKVLTGGVSSRLFIGAVSDSWGFFEKNGYRQVGGCEEMLMELKNFSKDDYRFQGHELAEYGWYDGGLEELQEAVARVDETWVRYFTDPAKVYVGRVGVEIASFCLVDIHCQNYLSDVYGEVGMPGCVGCVPEYRNKGIALEMIANVTQYLKEQGMDISFIFFTGVARWYEKIGYETFLREIFGEKELKSNTAEVKGKESL